MFQTKVDMKCDPKRNN